MMITHMVHSSTSRGPQPPIPVTGYQNAEKMAQHLASKGYRVELTLVPTGRCPHCGRLKYNAALQACGRTAAACTR